MIPSTENSKRIKILKQSEIDELYEIPKFTDDERKWYFELHGNESKLLTFSGNKKTKVDAILQLGYFKAKNQFFKYGHDEVLDDIEYIVNQYFGDAKIIRFRISREIKRKNQIRILEIKGHQYFKKTTDGAHLLIKARELCRVSINPVFIFHALMEIIYKKKITTPGYTTLQDIISKAFALEQQRIKRIFDKQLLPDEKDELLKLMKKKDSFYAVTSLKSMPKNFKHKSIYREIEHYQNYLYLYLIAKRIIPHLKISSNSIVYFADLVDHYTVQALDRQNEAQTCLWLLCFIYNRAKRILDNLVLMFSYIASQYKVDVTEEAKILILADKIEKNSQNESISKLLRLFIDSDIDDSLPFRVIKEEKAYTIALPEIIDQISQGLDNEPKDYQAQFTWKAVRKVSPRYKPLLRALLKVLPFESEQHKALLKAINFLKSSLSGTKPLSKIPFKDFPKQHIGKKVKRFVYDDTENKVFTDCYEYHCYQLMKKYVDAGSIFVNESSKYRPLSSELIQKWPEKKSGIIRRINRPLLSQPLTEFIIEKGEPLDDKIIAVNEAILDGENPDLKIKKTKDGDLSWTLPYQAQLEHSCDIGP